MDGIDFRSPILCRQLRRSLLGSQSHPFMVLLSASDLYVEDISNSTWRAKFHRLFLTSTILCTGLEMQARGPNNYVKLGVTRASNPLEIKRAYKKLSLQLQ